MGDFFTPPAGSPLPPPEPDIPPPDFSTIANGIGVGLQKSGITGSFWNGLFEILVKVVTTALGIIVSTLLRIFAFFTSILGDATTDSTAAYNQLVAATLKELFGVVVAPTDVAGRTSSPGRETAATSIGQTIINTMYKGATPAPGGGILPSSAAADNFLGAAMKMQLNGWIESFVVDGLSYHLLEKYGDLKDGIERTLGMGRMSRAAFRAPMKIFATDPYMQLLERTYRTRVWEVQSLMRQFAAGQIQRTDLSAAMGIQGYTEAQIDELVVQHTKYLPLADLDYLDRRGLSFGTFTHDQLVAQGWTPSTADTIITIMQDRRVQKYRDQMVTIGEDAYVRGDIGPDTFATILQNAGVSQTEQDWIQQVATLKVQCKVRHLTEGEITTGIEDGLLNFNDLKTWATREGMLPTDEAILELEIQFKENKAAALAQTKAKAAAAKLQAAQAKLQLAQQKAAAATAQAADKGLSASQAGILVKDGIWTIAQYQQFLVSRGYGTDAVTASTQLLQAEMNSTAVKTAAAAATKASAAAKGLNLGQIEKAVIEGIATEDQLMGYLTGHGYDAADAQVIVDLTHNALTTAQAKAAAKVAATTKAASKSISLPELERAVRLGLTTADTYTAALQKAGFDAASVTLLDGILQSQMATDTATKAKSAAAAAAKNSKGVTLAQIEQEVIGGIRPIADYSSALVSLGYDAADQIQLTALLQLKVDQAASTAAKRTAAAKAAAARGVSLPDTERAVKLGVVPVSVYTSLLQSLNYTPDAVDVLTNSLIAQMAATRKTQTATNAAGTALAAKSISLGTLEKAVIAGLQPIATYTATLTSAGYSDADAATMTELLQLKVDQAARAKATHADADGKATQKGIALAKEEAAVVAGDKTMDDYNALLISLGYDDVDRAVLDQLLQAKIDAAAAKAGSSATPADTGTAPSGGA